MNTQVANLLDFKPFKIRFQNHFTNLLKDQTHLYEVDVDKDTLWDSYLNSFPLEHRQDHNCNCCRQFIKNYGNLVVIKDNQVYSIWGFDAGDSTFQAVVDALNNLVTSKPIRDVFVTTHSKLGTDYNFASPSVKWEHFYFQLPKSFVTRLSVDQTEGSLQNELRNAKATFKRSLTEITQDAVETVLELIAQKSLYRGEEFKGVLEAFLKCQKEYAKLTQDQKDNYCWVNSVKLAGTVAKIRNTSIGTLLQDISIGEDLDVAVTKFERIMAPANYKRPQAIVTKKMVEDAEKQIAAMGLTDSLPRRFASSHDITVNNVLFVDRSVKTASSSIFDQLKEDAAVNPKQFAKVETISVEDFIKNIVPTATSIEVLLENKHEGNLVSLIAPVNFDAPSLFKWNNGFSWSYNNALADSMKERVKEAGGKVDGVLRFSIQWNDNGDNNIDFDAHCQNRLEHIYFSTYKKPSIAPSTGQLDVDVISPQGKVAVENITWSNLNKMQEGKYTFWVNNYSTRTSNGGFSAEIEYGGEIYSFEYPKNLKGGENIVVAEVEFSKSSGLKFIKSLDPNSTVSSKELWNLKTNKFHKVNLMCYSPNHWDEQGIGNKHVFFMLEGAKNTGDVRGFFNEFLPEQLLKQKRVFEALGHKMKVEDSDNQLSGLGFSSTQKAEVVVKVTGKFTRTLKVVV